MMVGNEKILDNYLQIAGNRIGTKLFLDKNGICVLKKDNSDNEYVVELPKASEVVYFYAPICKVPYECSEEFFEKVLEMNLCGLEYNQATFGLDAKTQNIVISYTRSMASLDEVSFANILCNFVKTVDRAKKNLNNLKTDLVGQNVLTEEDVDMEMKMYTSEVRQEKLRA